MLEFLFLICGGAVKEGLLTCCYGSIWSVDWWQHDVSSRTISPISTGSECLTKGVEGKVAGRCGVVGRCRL